MTRNCTSDKTMVEFWCRFITFSWVMMGAVRNWKILSHFHNKSCPCNEDFMIVNQVCCTINLWCERNSNLKAFYYIISKDLIHWTGQYYGSIFFFKVVQIKLLLAWFYGPGPNVLLITTLFDCLNLSLCDSKKTSYIYREREIHTYIQTHTYMCVCDIRIFKMYESLGKF